MQKLVIFSLLNLIAPLTGSIFGFVGATGLVFTFFVARKVLGFGLVTWGLPTILASAKWALDMPLRPYYALRGFEGQAAQGERSMNSARARVINQVLNFLVSFVLPVLCMILFMVHPVGQQAFIYSFYWVIPVVIYVGRKLVRRLGVGQQGAKFFGVGSIFLTALSSTFIAHAVGSVMCLYMVPMVTAQWLALIPVVALERFVLAAGSTVAYVLVRTAVRSFYGVRVFGVQVSGALCGKRKECVSR